jgi:hypothetical protein
MKRKALAKALVVELIRRLWDRGLLSKFSKWAVAIHDNWLSEWIDYKTGKMMLDVDRQAEEIRTNAEAAEAKKYQPKFTETQKGETPLGGPMRLSSLNLGLLDDIQPADNTPTSGSQATGAGDRSAEIKGRDAG